ncbi:MAG: cytochrome c oxidase subunit II [Candidatus Lambdaproteobacteria bacterium]|nr:cytochrome c oxidase subunit II [Candidatus Lambdaproteobacteria bacterium]
MTVSNYLANSCRRAWVALPLAGFLVSGCFGDGRQSTIRPASDVGHAVQAVYSVVTWIDIGIFIVVFGLLIVALIRFRGGKEGEMPKQVHGNPVMEILWTLVPAVLLIFIAVPTWSTIFLTANPPKENAVHVLAIGKQWWWEFEYVDSGVVTGNELHVPVNRPIVITTRSTDVIHSFWVPRLSGKIDSLPGKDNVLWFTPQEKGVFYGQCAEYCGTSHANMRFRVIVEDEADYEKWLASVTQPPVPQTAEAKEGEQLFLAKACVACHTITGVPGAVGKVGPNLTNLGARSSIASATIENTPQNLAAWIHDSRSIKPGVLMILPLPVSVEEAGKLAAYLTSPTGPAPGAPAPQGGATLNMKQPPAGAAAAAGGGLDGKTLFLTKGCTGCHTVQSLPLARGTIGPALDGLQARPRIAAGVLPNTEANLKRWIKDPPSVKPGTLMVKLGLSDAEVETIVAFLKTL